VLGPCYDHHRRVALAQGSVPSAGSGNDFKVITVIGGLAYLLSPARLLLGEASTMWIPEWRSSQRNVSAHKENLSKTSVESIIWIPGSARRPVGNSFALIELRDRKQVKNRSGA
jgi:hypothetical protein